MDLIDQQKADRYEFFNGARHVTIKCARRREGVIPPSPVLLKYVDSNLRY
jgi:hypothetical protein